MPVTADFQDDNIAPLGNPGNNPFTGTVTDGIVVEANNVDVFAALGSTGDISQPTVGLISDRTLAFEFTIDAEIGVVNVSGELAQGDGAASTVVSVSDSFGIAGDYQPNGNVDIIDFGLFGAAFGNPAASFPDSDFDKVGENIDIIDFGIFGANFGLSMPSAGGVGAAVVPEPSTIVLLGLAGVCGLAVARRR